MIQTQSTPMRRHFFRQTANCLTGLVLALAAFGAAAQTPDNTAAAGRKFVAVSLLGDTIHMITRQDKTGSMLDANLRESFELKGGVFDQAALSAVEQSVRKADVKATVFGLKLASANVLGEPGALLDGKRFVMPAALAPVLQQLQASHLLLITPHRGEANIKTLRDAIGMGRLEGQGFFIDRDAVVRFEESSELSKGYLAPFSYFKISVIDLAGNQVVAQKLVMRAESLITRRKEAVADPWAVLSDGEKVEALRKQIREEIAGSLPDLIGGL